MTTAFLTILFVVYLWLSSRKESRAAADNHGGLREQLDAAEEKLQLIIERLSGRARRQLISLASDPYESVFVSAHDMVLEISVILDGGEGHSNQYRLHRISKPLPFSDDDESFGIGQWYAKRTSRTEHDPMTYNVGFKTEDVHESRWTCLEDPFALLAEAEFMRFWMVKSVIDGSKPPVHDRDLDEKIRAEAEAKTGADNLAFGRPITTA